MRNTKKEDFKNLKKIQKFSNVALVLLRDKSIVVGAQYKKGESKNTKSQKSSNVALVLLRDKSISVGAQNKKKNML